MNCTYLPYSRTGFYSDLVLDYLRGGENVKPFYKYDTDINGIRSAIEERKKFPVNRTVLAEVLRAQYKNLEQSEKLKDNIRLLSDERTFTICTAHQPNLLTGYLYFIYKIIHAIRLADELKEKLPAYNFVPVYYMGSEDNDLDELGVFRYGSKKFIWDAAGQTGAVGRMDTKSLKPIFDELFKLLGPPGKQTEQLIQTITKAYLGHDDIASATQYFVNELFGKHGLVVINPDDFAFKRAFAPVMLDDMDKHTAYTIVTEQLEHFEKHYKSQAHPREVNLFYLKDNLRERIEKKGEQWHVVNTDISFSRAGIEKELNDHPERFSPNVILRGLFQETILPDVAFIGGGSEVAYWLQLKTLFEHFNVFYPVVMLRQSVLWIDAKHSKLIKQLGLNIDEIFHDESSLLRQYLERNSINDWQTKDETREFENLFHKLKTKATTIDTTLKSSAEAALTKIKHQLQVLENKMLKAEKRKGHITLNKLVKLKSELFPNNSLQERVENFASYYTQYGQQYFDIVYECTDPLRNEFLVIETIN